MGRHPGQGLAIQGRRVSAHGPAEKGVQGQGKITPVVIHADEMAADFDVQIQFFLYLTGQTFPQAFPRLLFPAREFPAAPVASAGLPPADQHPALVENQGRGDLKVGFFHGVSFVSLELGLW